MKDAVVVIDVQRGLFETEPPPFEADVVVARINAVTGHARSKGIPVIFVQHERERSVLAHAGEGWELHSGLEVSDGDIRVRKTTPDSFLRTDLEEVLKGGEIERLHVCGYASEFCVDTTVRSAAAHGYAVNIISDSHTTHDKEHLSGGSIREHHNRTLPDITSFGVTITTMTSGEFLRS
ncbi:cysteine hydrolase family protein [Salidesulfovibrio onnuriiensis]|uniref:cysteine hydrolase family protein n=1 Tax=Salidesulfovibrio onnuriiensis TaxID=2583823 RepID=UPI0011CCD2AE|nr:cysteine hydrolase family protein [Salidesulfovibrio onnuriiensis]